VTRRDLLRRNIALSYVHVALISGIAIIAPTLVLYWQEHGVTLAEASVIEGAFFLVIALLSIPNGMLADRKGRKVAIVVGSCLFALALGGYILAKEFWGFLFAEVVLAAALASLSGATQALVTDSVEEVGEGAHKKLKTVGNLRTVSFGAWMCGSFVGGFLFEVNRELPLSVAFVFALGAILVALCLKETSIKSDVATVALKEQFLKAFRFSFKENGRLKEILLLSGMFAGLYHGGVVLIPGYFKASGLTESGIGMLAGMFHLTAIGSCQFCVRLNGRVSERQLLTIASVLIAIGYGMMSLSATIGCALFAFLFHVARGYTETAFSAAVDDECSKDNKATVLSIRNTLDSLSRVAMLLPIGILGDAFGFGAPFAILSVLAIGVALILVRERRVSGVLEG